jgi:hypothetical protein
MLKGGYESDTITVLYGPAGSGKTCLCILAALALLGAVLGLLFLLLQVAVLMLPVSCVSAALMFATYLVYTQRRIKQLVKASPDFSGMTTARFDSNSMKWNWQIESAKVLPFLDPGMGRALMVCAGIMFSLFALNNLKARGAFTHQVFWFWGRTANIPEPASIVLGSVFQS